jgi:radical SAM protein with 4Fe4S-binding SPASM domain
VELLLFSGLEWNRLFPRNGDAMQDALLKKYPVLKNMVSAYEIIKPEGVTRLIYNTVTGKKKRPNEAVMNFFKLATGVNTCEDILDALKHQSGEPADDIWPGLSHLISQMVDQGLLTLLDTPGDTPKRPISVELMHPLEGISFEITRKCNLECRHCYANAGDLLPDELTPQEIKAFIDDVYNTGCLSITFSGGEPLLHPDIFELMEYAKQKPLSVLLFTNGTLLTPDIVKKLKNLPVYKVSVSIDGPDAETHDALRGVPGAFDKTIKGVNLLKEAHIPVKISVSLTKLNYRKIPEILTLLKNLKVDDFKMWLISYSGRPQEKDIFLGLDEFRTAMEEYWEYQLGPPPREKDVFEYDKTENCGIGKGALCVKCNGVVTPCPGFGEDVSLGNIRHDSLQDIWNNSELLNRLRGISVYDAEPCKTCEFALICKGGCLADVYGRSGKFVCHDEYMCITMEVTKDDFIPVEKDTESDELSVEMV